MNNNLDTINKSPKVVDSLTVPKEPKSLGEFLNSDKIKSHFIAILGEKKYNSFLSSILAVVRNNTLLLKADPASIAAASKVAATLDLPINQNLGFSYIVPYKGSAQFQIGYKGFIQLAIRSEQFKNLTVSSLTKSQFKFYNPVKDELIYDFQDNSNPEIVVYVAYMQLINGFEKYFVMTVEELKHYAITYSQSFKSGFGVWKDNFKAMAEKTVLKLMLSKYAPLSTEMQTAIEKAQATIEGEFNVYPDNSKDEPKEKISKNSNDSVVEQIDWAELDEMIAPVVN
ncbi:recombination and repair protein RecT [Candidatus Hepatincolaceae symbiont of Richtersius coronifer]